MRHQSSLQGRLIVEQCRVSRKRKVARRRLLKFTGARDYSCCDREDLAPAIATKPTPANGAAPTTFGWCRDGH